jgi:hypothetical protein
MDPIKKRTGFPVGGSRNLAASRIDMGFCKKLSVCYLVPRLVGFLGHFLLLGRHSFLVLSLMWSGIGCPKAGDRKCKDGKNLG